MSVKFKKWLKRGICFIAGCGIGFCIGYGIVSSIPKELLHNSLKFRFHFQLITVIKSPL